MDISSMLEVQVNEIKEIDSKENVTPKEFLPNMTKIPAHISEDECRFYMLAFGNDISAVRFQRLHCTACDIHIGSAPANSHNMFEHPVLRTLLCAKCREFYGDGIFEQGDDATDMFCRWCANGGNLYCCSFCSNTFCYKCIKRNFKPTLRKRIEADERWKCFVCDPRDLYPARRTCWALLHHVQTLNRLFQSNCNLSQLEIDEKMNADESQCCLRRKKKKRCRYSSNSEEDDISYVPKNDESTPALKRGKRGSMNAKFSNGKISGENTIDQSEIFPSLLSCEQTMTECEDVTVSGDGRIISQKTPDPVFKNVRPVNAQQPTMRSPPIMNVVPTSTLLPSLTQISPVQQMPCSLNQINKVNLYQKLQSISTSVVMLQNRNITVRKQPVSSKPKPLPRTVLSSSPGIIEIEIDSEDASDASTTKGLPGKNISSINKAVPVALVSSKKSYDNARKLDFQELCNAKTLNQRLLPHGEQIDNVLKNLRKKFQGWFVMSKKEELKKYELGDARCLIKQFHRDIRDTVTQLAHINDRIIREYNRWKRPQGKVTDVKQPPNRHASSKQSKHSDIPLEMICINESDSDTNGETDTEYSVIEPSEFVGDTNVVNGMKFFKMKKTIDCGVGDASTLLADKSVQISDGELRDYDVCIQRSVVEVVNEEFEKTNSLSHSHAFEKQLRNYEKHFIEFLRKQNTENQSTNLSKSKHQNQNDVSLKDLTDTNIPLVPQTLETIENSDIASKSNPIIAIRKESDLKTNALQTTSVIECRFVDSVAKVVDKLTLHDVLSSKPSENKTEHSNVQSVSNVTNAIKIEEQNLNRIDVIDSEGSNEDDCTIIDELLNN